MFYATHPEFARDPTVGRDPHFENHCISQLPINCVPPISEQPNTKRGRSLGKIDSDEFKVAR
ncbi:hypothetical protein T10_1615 [Trichinella papuae]|uniref:Uncharacterized protein n=1 Tax=Trichinella papuae TaxID=268474 RepID=A0A0V1MMH6_9BILA|nr:hypothetical protein T10_1615 [Trichinella papuae]